jgi:hypothetical protein
MVSKSLPQSFKNGQFLVQSLLFAPLEYAAMDKLSIDFDVLKNAGFNVLNSEKGQRGNPVNKKT